jgi:hypothetical protein
VGAAPGRALDGAHACGARCVAVQFAASLGRDHAARGQNKVCSQPLRVPLSRRPPSDKRRLDFRSAADASKLTPAQFKALIPLQIVWLNSNPQAPCFASASVTPIDKAGAELCFDVHTYPSVTVGAQKYYTAAQAARGPGRCSWIVEPAPPRSDDDGPSTAFAFGQIVEIWTHESAVNTNSTNAQREVWFVVDWFAAERGGYDPELMLPRFRTAAAGGGQAAEAAGGPAAAASGRGRWTAGGRGRATAGGRGRGTAGGRAAAAAGGVRRVRKTGPLIPARAVVPMHISPVPHPTLKDMLVVVPAERDWYFMTRCGWAGPPL